MDFYFVSTFIADRQSVFGSKRKHFAGPNLNVFYSIPIVTDTGLRRISRTGEVF